MLVANHQVPQNARSHIKQDFIKFHFSLVCQNLQENIQTLATIRIEDRCCILWLIRAALLINTGIVSLYRFPNFGSYIIPQLFNQFFMFLSSLLISPLHFRQLAQRVGLKEELKFFHSKMGWEKALIRIGIDLKLETLSIKDYVKEHCLH